jgi:hypothetical protein
VPDPERLKFGAVYSTSIAGRRGFNFDGLPVKMVIRY